MNLSRGRRFEPERMRLANRWIIDSVIDVAFQDIYILGKEFGKGSSSQVKAYQCTERATFEQWSVKILTKKDPRRGPKVELGLFRRLVHPHLARLREVYETEIEIHLVVELLNGGEVFDRIELKYNLYSEKDAAKCVRELIQAIQYLHENGVTHGNLKAENLLYDSTNEGAKLKVSDFYMSTLVSQEVLSNSVCVTPGYSAPEMLKGRSRGPAADMWSIGVITYLLLSGNEPFFAASDAEVFKKILRCHCDLNSYEWDIIGLSAKDFVRRLLVKDPGRRLSPGQALRHPWIVGTSARNESLETVQDRIKLFNSKRKLTLAVQAVSSSNYDEMLALQDNLRLFENASSLVLTDSTNALTAPQHQQQQGRTRDQAVVPSSSAVPGLTVHLSAEGTEFGMAMVPSAHDGASETNTSQ